MTTFNPIPSMLAHPQPAGFDAPPRPLSNASSSTSVDVDRFDRAARGLLPYVWSVVCGVWTAAIAMLFFLVPTSEAVLCGSAIASTLVIGTVAFRRMRRTDGAS